MVSLAEKSMKTMNKIDANLIVLTIDKTENGTAESSVLF